MPKGLLLLLVLFSTVVVLLSQPTSTSPSSTQAKQLEQSKPIQQPESRHWYQDSAWWLVIIGGATAFVIGWQSLETRRAAQASRDSIALFRSKERARLAMRIWATRWITPTNIVVVSPIHAPYIQFRVTNFGPTHAFNVRLFVAYLVTGSESPEALTDFRELEISNTIKADDKDRYPVLHPALEENSGELRSLLDGRTFMQVAAKLTYTDVFGEQRETRMRSIWSKNGSRSDWTEHGEPIENDAT